jgi:hypothetical protein
MSADAGTKMASVATSALRSFLVQSTSSSTTATSATTTSTRAQHTDTDAAAADDDTRSKADNKADEGDDDASDDNGTERRTTAADELARLAPDTLATADVRALLCDRF